jgi:small-conductance mechanosensitive channel
VLATDLTLGDWVAAVGIVLAGLLVAAVIQRIIRRLVAAEDGAHAAGMFLGRMAALLVGVGAFVYGLSGLGVRLAPLLGALGIGGLAVAFAAQSILANLFASVMLQIRRPFKRGDQIKTGDHEGTVLEVNFRTVVLRSFDGERVMIPSSQVLDNAIVNYTARGIRRSTLEVGVAYEADLAEAQRLMVEATRCAEGVLPHPLPEAWVEELGESTVDFSVRFWHAPDQVTMWRVRSNVAMEVKRALDGAEIALPYPQIEVRFPDQ